MRCFEVESGAAMRPFEVEDGGEVDFGGDWVCEGEDDSCGGSGEDIFKIFAEMPEKYENNNK